MVGASVVRYRSVDEDSGRWQGFPFRDGDIVISTRSKSGTTWMQMICALLVFRTPELPAPLAQLSPWLDWLAIPRDEVYAQLIAQRHRRFIKTHTPLDGVPIDPRVTYIVVARHPLDAAVSLYHQGDNTDRERLARRTGQALASATSGKLQGSQDGQPRTHRHSESGRPPRPPLRECLLAWIDEDADPREQLDSLPGVLRHLSDAWARRRDQPNVVLVHYDDLSADLDGEMRRLAHRLGITVDDATWPRLVDAARFEQMRARADRLAPDAAGILRDRTRFFRRGSSGAGRELLTADELARYHARAAQLAGPDLLTWLHRAGDATGPAPLGAGPTTPCRTQTETGYVTCCTSGPGRVRRSAP